MPFDNLLDISRLLKGTCSFTLDDVACIGDIQRIEYVPLGPGHIDFDLVDIRTVVGQHPVTHVAHHSVSCFLAEVTDRPREMIIDQLLSTGRFGRIFSFRCRD